MGLGALHNDIYQHLANVMNAGKSLPTSPVRSLSANLDVNVTLGFNY